MKLLDGMEFPVLFVGSPIFIVFIIVLSLFLGVYVHSIIGAIVFVALMVVLWCSILKSHDLWWNRGKFR